MKRENIDLFRLNIIQGDKLSDKGGLSLKPDRDRFIRLRLDGDTAFMGGVEWNDQKYLIIDMLSDMDAMTTVDVMFFKAENADKNEQNIIKYHMIPTKRVKLAVRLDELESRRYFLPTLPGTLKGHVRCMPTNISFMNAVELYIHPGYSHAFKSFKIYEMYLSDEIPDMTVIGEPMVDEMGQWIQKDWNTKTHSIEEMVSYLKEEYKRAETDNRYPDGWSKYGGYKKIKFDVVFGEGTLLLNPDIPTLIKGDAVFGSVYYPDNSQVSFGSRTYEFSIVNRTDPYLLIDADAVFGRLNIRFKSSF
jgi:hypothetical protein